MTFLKVAVLQGGLSREREISLKSGAAVAAALQRKGYDVVSIDAGADLVARLKEARPDAAFVALHGRFGEDGTVQGILEIMGIPYTGSGVTASAVSLDKVMAKRVVAAAGVRVAPDRVWEVGDSVEELGSAWPYGWPAVVKPNQEGSSLGLVIAHSEAELIDGLRRAAEFDSKVLIEPFIRGREVTVGLLQDGSSVQVLPTLEVVPKKGVYDFTSKYTKGETVYEVPASISKVADEALKEASRRAWTALGLSGFGRADFILDAHDGRPVFLEMNTIPGFTELSLVPMAAAAAGIRFDDLVERILRTACLKIGTKK